MIKKNILSFSFAVIIVFLSLTGSKTFDDADFFRIPYLDKIAHLGMYFMFTSIILFEHRNSIRNTKQLILMAIIPFIFGIAMELLQLYLTTDRSADLYDIFFNSAGVIIAAFLWVIIRSLFKERVR